MENIKTLKLLTSKTSSNGTNTLIQSKQLTEATFTTNFNGYFKSVGREPVENTNPHQFLNHAPLHSINIGEIKLFLEKLDSSKATNSLDFFHWISINGKKDLCIPPHNIINAMLETGEYPNIWKQADITPIPKIHQPAQNKNFRPISLPLYLGKLAEKVFVINYVESSQQCIRVINMHISQFLAH